LKNKTLLIIQDCGFHVQKKRNIKGYYPTGRKDRKYIGYKLFSLQPTERR
jgi:hypothetical protein